MNHLDNHNLLYPLQHGFRSKLSCETQLLTKQKKTFTQEIVDSMASGKQTCSRYGFFQSLRQGGPSKTIPQIKMYGYKQQNIKLDRDMVITQISKDGSRWPHIK